MAPRPLATVRRYFGRWGLIAALAALPIYYGITDLINGYQAGFVAGHVVIHHDLSKLGFNFAEGLSNGAIWALIAIGYTLVYGIIELINFAHGDVFMIGSFTAVGLWATLGLGLTTGALGLTGGLIVALIITMIVTRVPERPDRAGRLPAAAERAQARVADHGGRLLVHSAERGPALARGLTAERARPDPLAATGVHHGGVPSCAGTSSPSP